MDLLGAKHLSYLGKWSDAEYIDVRLCGPPLSGRRPLSLSAATLVDDTTLYHPAHPLRIWLDHHYRLGVEHVMVGICTGLDGKNTHAFVSFLCDTVLL